MPLVYEELRRLAAQRLAQEKPGQTLQPTALVHEAYLRLVGADDADRWDNRGHFFAAAAEAMRRILVEKARRKRTQKHGGGLVRLDADEVELPIAEPREDLIALDEALTELEKTDATAAKLVTMRYFAGLTQAEAAQAARHLAANGRSVVVLRTGLAASRTSRRRHGGPCFLKIVDASRCMRSFTKLTTLYLPRRGCITKPRVALRAPWVSNPHHCLLPRRGCTMAARLLCNPFGVGRNLGFRRYPGCAKRNPGLCYATPSG